MPKRICIDCRRLFDMATAPGQRCPPCKQAHEAARGTTAQRGYGAAHQALRARLVAAWTPGDPCAICGLPMVDRDRLDLAHNEDRTGYLGLAHDTCNRGHH